MKVRSGFVSNSSTSSFICTFIGVPEKKIVKHKKDKIVINGETIFSFKESEYEDEDAAYEKDREYIIDEFFNKKKIKLATVGNNVGFILSSESDCLSYSEEDETSGSTDVIGDLFKIQKKWNEAITEFKKIGYEGPLKMYQYSEVGQG